VNVTSRDLLKRAYLSADGQDRPLKSPVLPATIESARRYRLARLRQQLRLHDCAAALLYDPINIRYALDAPNMQLWTLHNAYRHALIFAEGPAILFEFNGCEHLCRGLPGIEQVVAFGTTLHVSGRDAEKLRASVSPWMTGAYHWEPIDSGLEDVFISLMETAKDDFS